MQNKTYKVSYVCNTMFLKWETVVTAKNEDEAVEIVSKKGRVVDVSEALDGE